MELLLLLTADPAPSSVLPALSLLPHRLRTAHPRLPHCWTPGSPTRYWSTHAATWSPPAACAGCCAPSDQIFR
jgi:hypothetical protein